MNDTLTGMQENDAKAETKVFAGGAVIAKQSGNPTMFHELMHHAASYGGLANHEKMAIAAFASLTANERSGNLWLDKKARKAEMKKNNILDKEDYYSDYFEKWLEHFCPTGF